jgi:hypothetical protein
MAARAIQAIRDDPDFATMLVEERGGGLIFYELVEPFQRPPWEAYYTRWARIVALDPRQSVFGLEYMRYTNKWQPLPFTGTLEECVQAIQENTFGVFDRAVRRTIQPAPPE